MLRSAAAETMLHAAEHRVEMVRAAAMAAVQTIVHGATHSASTQLHRRARFLRPT